ncbi:MAG TPA: flagellar basal body L-ring protein FlgH [Sphingomicrobium sp.]|nr:flagellar basal body L-ring protein FlgH [Sphingomicrobium sp.]
MPTSSFRALALLPLLGLAACIDGTPRPSPEFRPAFAEPVLPPAVPNGAIFQASNGYAPLTSGSRAAAVGDILTIDLAERTQAKKENSAAANRKGAVGLTPPATGILSKLKPSDINMSGDQSFTGGGQATQSNQLSGEISVTIAQVYPNGTMLVRGEKLVTLNRGDEYVRLAGLVRAQDISPDNRIPSTRVADARITYSGRGELARASRQGWLQRFFSILSPF